MGFKPHRAGFFCYVKLLLLSELVGFKQLEVEHDEQDLLRLLSELVGFKRPQNKFRGKICKHLLSELVGFKPSHRVAGAPAEL